jgi:hypothetical protein
MVQNKWETTQNDARLLKMLEIIIIISLTMSFKILGNSTS